MFLKAWHQMDLHSRLAQQRFVEMSEAGKADTHAARQWMRIRLWY
jgi:hypothetical protein